MRKARPTISAILPARRAADTIDLAVRSTLAALSSADELVIITEFGDEATIHRIEQYTDRRISHITTSGPSSVSEKLNLGLGVARSDLIARIDADDVSLPWRFWIQRRRVRNGGIDFSFSTCIVFGSALRPLPVLPQIPISLSEQNFVKALIVSNPAVHPTMIASKTTLKSLGGYRDVPGEDLDLWLRGAVAGLRFERIFVPTILYRYRKNSLSRDESTKSHVQNDRILLQMRLDLLRRVLPLNDFHFSIDEDDFDSIHLDVFKRALKRKLLFKIELMDLGLNH